MEFGNFVVFSKFFGYLWHFYFDGASPGWNVIRIHDKEQNPAEKIRIQGTFFSTNFWKIALDPKQFFENSSKNKVPRIPIFFIGTYLSS